MGTTAERETRDPDVGRDRALPFPDGNEQVSPAFATRGAKAPLAEFRSTADDRLRLSGSSAVFYATSRRMASGPAGMAATTEESSRDAIR
ncbi:MAG: hypothetical protein WA609_06925 [Terriglobales bacterium]